MKFQVIAQSARSMTLELINQDIYFSNKAYAVYLDGKCIIEKENKNVVSVYDLTPSTTYKVAIKSLEENYEYEQLITTDEEFVCLNVKRFGAVGDGQTEDTAALQAAILSCPDKGCVQVPKGIYLTGPLFLKSNMTLLLEEGAVLLGLTDRNKYPILPGYTLTTDEKEEYYLGTWEGNPLNAMAALITGINVENVKIVGPGTLDGNAHQADWYQNPRQRRRAWRPRMVFLNNCKNITIQGISVKNSPSWTIHPYFSENLKFIDMRIHNASNSPNTDGIDPESCKNLEIIGTKISVGDDCIAIKSGKLFMGKKFKRPSENFEIRNCLMERGHGAVVLGSEIAGGVKNIHVSQCVFKETDRGLRIKTRRGRGKNSIVDAITFEKIAMEEVYTPFVINMYYYCDPDGKTEYVWSKEALPLDDWTPKIGKLTFKDITCKDCHVAATYFYGLPEQPIEEVIIENVDFSFKEEAEKEVPAMMSGLEPMKKVGIFANQVKKLVLSQVSVTGYEGEKMILDHIQEFVEK